MSVRGGGRRRVPDHAANGHDGPDERWMASYLDMVTVLMCLFIVLFAMSSVDQQKFDALRDSLATGFGQEPTDEIDFSGLVLPPELRAKDVGYASNADLAAAQAELDDLRSLRERLEGALEARGIADTAEFTIDDRGLTVGLVGAETFFSTNSVDLTAKAVTVLDALGSVLVDVPNRISVEGHADHRAPVAPYPTNWELSSGRATQVLRHLVEADGLQGDRTQAVGFGATRPLADGSDDESLARNRRVDIVVLSDAAEEVRALIPGLVEGDAPS
ncbi:OmpA/MotB family protein [Microbacterium marinilacus]|uniref:Flagellar motor protein MotB n=1 Tax=Microbacterium marinilacus TaxID=415209 RepID=A0ABP7BNT5_9MICO|nr:flagellar motor protein MotB [Microbacterium marinilacus]MBY0687720.1 flagellar motor protein MotB [Microbacterium marinilacus]